MLGSVLFRNLTPTYSTVIAVKVVVYLVHA